MASLKKIFQSQFFLLFIMAQPFIDILTSFSILTLDWSLSVGTIVRSVFLVIMTIYLLLEGDKYTKVYTVLLLLFFSANIAVNYMVKNGFHLMEELKYCTRYIFTIQTVFCYINYLKKLKDKNAEISVLSKFHFYLFVVVLVFFISQITGTTIKSYSFHRLGHSGWFYAANDMGTTISQLLALSSIYAIMRYVRDKKWIFLFVPIAAIGPLLSLGTKGGYLGAIIAMLGAAIACLWEFILRKNKSILKPFVLFTCLFALILFLYPRTYVAYNVNYVSEVKEEEGATQEEKQEYLIHSGRDKFLNDTASMYANAHPLQKVFGMGLYGNYIGYYEEGDFINPIEKDYHELYYYYGILGLLFYLAPIVYFVLKTARILLRQIRKVDYRHILYFTTIGIGLGSANFSGHVFSAPSVGYVLMIAIAMAYVSVTKWERE